MSFDLRAIDLDKLDTMTKYPSIETFHKLEGKGMPSETIQVYFGEEEEVFLTEKADGCNTRLVFCPDGNILVGSRDEFLWAVGDIVPNTKLGLVATVRDYVESHKNLCEPDRLLVTTVEVIGTLPGRVCKRYGLKQPTFRLFDAFYLGIEKVQELLELPIERIASWRDNGGQPYFGYSSQLPEFALEHDMQMVPSVCCFGKGLPSTDRRWVLDFLRSVAGKISDHYTGKPEGVVVRNCYRTKIAKMRLEEYERWEKSQ